MTWTDCVSGGKETVRWNEDEMSALRGWFGWRERAGMFGYINIRQ